MNKDWCFTINNYTVEEFEQIKGISNAYMVIGQEVGKEGTSHLQGFIQFNCRKRLSTVKKIPGFERAHLEGRRGTPTEAATYCKKDGKYYEQGTLVESRQGQRTDLDEVRQCANEHGMREVSARYNAQQIRVAEAYLMYNEEPRDWQPEVTWIYGPSGTGKSPIRP